MRSTALWALLILALAAGCGNPNVVRKVPDGIPAYLGRAVDNYDSATGIEMKGNFDGSTSDRSAELARRLNAAGADKIRADGKLAALAGTYGWVFLDSKRLPSGPLREFLAGRMGVACSIRNWHVAWAASRRGRQHVFLDGVFVDAVEETRKLQDVNRVGFFHIDDGVRKGWGMVVATCPDELKGLKKRYAPGETIRFSGSFPVPVDRAVVLMSGDSPGVESEAVAIRQSGAFEVSLDAPRDPGVHHIQVQYKKAEESGKTQEWKTLFDVPVYVGVPEPEEPEAFVSNPTPNPDDMETWSDALLAIYNRERTKFGIPRLERLVKEGSTLDPTEAAEGDGSTASTDRTMKRRIDWHGVAEKDAVSRRWFFEHLAATAEERLKIPSERRLILDPRRTKYLAGFSKIKGDAHKFRSFEYFIEDKGAR
ncbi:MAG: hypothetical protein HY897_16530 [Deltaproteobacteria bacterium]|nr:hypothetical protein [Deltaproteobacteria bacterium]